MFALFSQVSLKPAAVTVIWASEVITHPAEPTQEPRLNWRRKWLKGMESRGQVITASIPRHTRFVSRPAVWSRRKLQTTNARRAATPADTGAPRPWRLQMAVGAGWCFLPQSWSWRWPWRSPPAWESSTRTFRMISTPAIAKPPGCPPSWCRCFMQEVKYTNWSW